MANSIQIAKAYSLRPLFTAILAVAMAFTLSCSGDDDGGGGSGNGGSSTPTPCEGGTVKIGTQTWQKCNLNVEPTTGNSSCYYDNCTYGRLYDFEAAMSVCPPGFHLPTIVEWDVLKNFIQNNKGCTGCMAKHLKSKNGWFENGNGLDSYGFSAFPGGYRYGNMPVEGGRGGNWWSANEDYSFQSHDVCSVHMSYGKDDVDMGGGGIRSGDMLSVRCLQDGNSSSSVQSDPVYGPSVDYEGETYQTVVIGTQTWMTRNLNYDVSGSECHKEDPANCEKFGRLYDWATAMALDSSCNRTYCASQIDAKHQGICPSGWHIPSDADWNTLIKFADPNCDSICDGNKLRSTRLWDLLCNGGGKGTDDFGFSAVAGGQYYGGWVSIGRAGYWWSSLQDPRPTWENWAYQMYIATPNSKVFNTFKNTKNSVRCLKN